MSTDSNSTAPRSWHEHAAHHLQGGGHAVHPPQMREPDFKFKLLYDWQVVKRARFEAAGRLEGRNSASLFTLSTVALYGGLITVFVLIFRESLSPHARNVCDWVSAVANWLTLTFSLTEQIKDYSGQARALHECARKVNDLRKRLQATPISAPQQLIPFVQAYDTIIAECAPNHDPLDYEIARYTDGRGIRGMTPAAVAKKLGRLRARSFIGTYAIYVVMCLAPALAGLTTWLLVPAPH